MYMEDTTASILGTPLMNHACLFFFLAVLQIGTFTTPDGEYFLEPLMNADGEAEYDDEHHKPHLVYRHERRSNISSDGEPCSASGNRRQTVSPS